MYVLFINNFFCLVICQIWSNNFFLFILKLFKKEYVLTSKKYSKEKYKCVSIIRPSELRLWNCDSSIPIYSPTQAMQFNALWKLHINSVLLFSWLKSFSTSTVGFFYKRQHLKNNEMSLFRIHVFGEMDSLTEEV